MTFIKDKKASEEFTSLPSLAIVMTGIVVFLAMISNLYITHEEKTKSMEYFETSYFIMEKMVSSDCPLTTSFLMMNIKNIENTSDEELKEYCNPSPFEYNITIYCEDNKIKSWGAPPHGLAISRYVAVETGNDVKIGKIVLWVWRNE